MKEKIFTIIASLVACTMLTACPDPEPNPTPTPTPEPVTSAANSDAVWVPDNQGYTYDDMGRVIASEDIGSYIYGERKILVGDGGSDDFKCTLTDGLIISGGYWNLRFNYNSKRQLIKAYDEDDANQYFNFIWNGDYLDRVEFSDPGEYLTKGTIYFSYKDAENINPSCLKWINSVMLNNLCFFDTDIVLVAEGYYGNFTTDKLISEIAQESDFPDSDYLMTISPEDINKYGCPETLVRTFDGSTDVIDIRWKRIK